MAFVHDKDKEFEKRVNPETVIWQKPETEYWKNFVKNLIFRHYEETDSKQSEKILKNFENEINNFYLFCPKEMIDKLENRISTIITVEIAC